MYENVLGCESWLHGFESSLNDLFLFSVVISELFTNVYQTISTHDSYSKRVFDQRKVLPFY